MFSTGSLPKYHDDLLLVKMRDELATAAATVGGGPTAMGRAVSWPGAGATGAAVTTDVVDPALSLPLPGLSTLARLERGGLVKRVTPLAAGRGSRRNVTVPRVAVATLVGAAAPSRTGGREAPAAGVCLIELERASDIDPLHRALADDPMVEFVSRVPVRYLLVPTRPARRRRAAAPPPVSTMWNLMKIEWAAARRRRGFRDATKIKVAVLDTGIETDHPDLKGRVKRYVFNYPGLPVVAGPKDIVGHGTHVAGTVAARISNRLGVNGICTCQLHVWKIFSDQTTFFSWDEGFGYVVDPEMYLRALADCLDADIDVVNLSIGGEGAPDAQELSLYEKLIRNGTVVVAAMGNERAEGSPTSYPAAIPDVMAVGATTITDRVASFSNRGNHIALCAPGRSIWSTLPTFPGQFGFDAVRGPRGKPIEGKSDPRETDVARMAYVRVDDEVDVGEVVGKLRDMEEIETPAEARERRLIRPRAAKGMG
jgi:hypothetical protein